MREAESNPYTHLDAKDRALRKPTKHCAVMCAVVAKGEVHDLSSLKQPRTEKGFRRRLGTDTYKHIRQMVSPRVDRPTGVIYHEKA